jgi:triosephosphate isomerase (TIM)
VENILKEFEVKEARMVVANWKLNKSYLESLQWCQENRQKLTEMAVSTKIIICPSFPVLAEVGKILKPAGVLLGAQNCAVNEKGSFTGEVSARSLSEAGCSYCIVGHSERRYLFHESEQEIGEKVQRLLDVGIIPLLCIGERDHCSDISTITQFLDCQLLSVQKLSEKTNKVPLVLVYEPTWAIGSKKTPDVETLGLVVSWIRSWANTYVAHRKVPILYGGSVDIENARAIWRVPGLGGVLVGGASLDFQNFKKIVLSA